MHSTHFIYCYMLSGIWLRTTDIMRVETRCHHLMGYSFQLAVMDLLCAPSNRQDSTYHSLCYTSCGALAGTRNSSMSPPSEIDPMTYCTMSGCSTTDVHPTILFLIKGRSLVLKYILLLQYPHSVYMYNPLVQY